MPSWIVHLATAKEVSKKISIKEENGFFMGNLIADAERYVVNDFSIFVPYKVSHYAELQTLENGQKEVLPSIEKFLENYKDRLHNPMILGYLTHLLTDFYWNQIAYVRFTVKDADGNFIGVKLNNGQELKCSKDERSNIKHEDFDIFKNYMIKNGDYIIPKYDKNLIDNLKDVKELPFNESDLRKIINYLEQEQYDEEMNSKEYKLFTSEQIKEDYITVNKRVINFLKDMV